MPSTEGADSVAAGFRLFERFRRPKRICTDPLFGVLEHDRKSAWQGHVTFPPLSGDVGIDIILGDQEPGEAERNRFLELVRRHESMRPAIGQALFDLYAPYRGRGSEGLPDPSTAEDMLSVTRLDWLEIDARGDLRLGYGFVDGAGWDDAMFTIRIADWTPSPEDLSD